MNFGQIEKLRGKKASILLFTLENGDNSANLMLKIRFEDTIYKIVFYNVSRLRITDFSRPMEIDGFEIVDNSPKGWSKDSRYEVRDFENEVISFFCENIEIQEKDSRILS